MPYDKEAMQGKKNNLPPKAPEPCVLNETFSDLFKPCKPKFKYGVGSVIIGTMIEGKNLKITNYESKD